MHKATHAPYTVPLLHNGPLCFLNTLLLPLVGSGRKVIKPSGISISVLVWVSNAMLYSVKCTVNGEENPQNCLLPLGLRHPAGGGPRYSHRQHVQKFGKDCACGLGDMLTDRQTDTHTDMLITILCDRSCGWSVLPANPKEVMFAIASASSSVLNLQNIKLTVSTLNKWLSRRGLLTEHNSACQILTAGVF